MPGIATLLLSSMVTPEFCKVVFLVVSHLGMALSVIVPNVLPLSPVQG